jgi:hypothetical protein
MPYINKEEVKAKRDAIKKAFPDFKFSIVCKNYSTISIHILEGNIELKKERSQINNWLIEKEYSDNPEAKEMLQKVYDIANDGNRVLVEDGDYGSVPKFYVDLEVGTWDKDYIFKPKTKNTEKKEITEDKTERIEKVKGLFKKYSHFQTLYAPFDSGKNLLAIAGMTQTFKKIEPFVVDEKKMLIFFNKEEKKTDEVKEEKSEIKKEAIAGRVEIINYSEKAIAVIGDTKPIKDKLKELGGKFNFRLTCGCGWIFPKTKLEEVKREIMINCAL